MTELQTFMNQDFGTIRGLEINNEPYLVGKDVAEKLGYSNTANAIKRHVDDEDKLTHRFSDSGQNRDMYIINESGFYALVFGSKLPTAKRFKHWVTSEVLPQIRRTGGYIPINQEDDERTILAKAVKIADKTISQKDALIKQLEPKAKMFDMFMDSSGTYSMNQVAKELKIGEYKLFQFLRDNKVLFYEGSDSVPYQRFVGNGCFKVVATIDPKGISHSTTRILPKGMKYIAKLLSKSERTVA